MFFGWWVTSLYYKKKFTELGIISGDDAKKFLDRMNNPEKLDQETMDRMYKHYNELLEAGKQFDAYIEEKKKEENK
jgi:hypothetical protein